MAKKELIEVDPDCQRYRAEQRAAAMPLDQLEREIAAGWAESARLKLVDELLGGYSEERGRILNRLLPLVTERERRRRDLADARKAAVGLVEVHRTERRSGSGYLQACVIATCVEGDEVAGPVWGHGEKSVFRALFRLDETCPCSVGERVGPSGRAPRHREGTAEQIAAAPEPETDEDEDEYEGDEVVGSLTTDDEVVVGSLTAPGEGHGEDDEPAPPPEPPSPELLAAQAAADALREAVEADRRESAAADRLEVVCKTCGAGRPLLLWRGRQLRADCGTCGRYVKFVPQTRKWLAVAPARSDHGDDEAA